MTAIRARTAADPLTAIVERVAEAMGAHGIKSGDAASGRGLLRVELEEHVQRIVQAYWTPFEANVPGRSVGLHLEVAEPRVHWAEGYLSPDKRSWVFCFHERDDGEVQLAYYAEFATFDEAIDMYFKLATWYVLTPTDVEWSDVHYKVSPELDWSEHQSVLAGASEAGAIQESLKKSTIIWLKWSSDGREQTMPVWYVLDQGKIYVLSGERQQTIPDAEKMRECRVVLRWKGKNARVAEVPASVRVLDHGPEWDQIAEKIAEKRLNIPGLPEDTARRWRDECLILELALRG